MKEGIVDVFNRWFDSRLERVHTMLPGKVESYSGHTTRKAQVKPLIKLKTTQGTSLDIPPINNVPVIFPSTGSFNLLFPINAGDNVLICFSEAGIGNYLNSQGTLDVEPDDLNRFALTDAICIPGLFPFTGVPQNPGASIVIDDQGNVNINQGSQGVARKEDGTTSSSTEDSAFWTFWSAMFGVIKGAPIPEPGNGAPSAFQSALAIALAAATPTSLAGKISEGSDTVQAG